MLADKTCHYSKRIHVQRRDTRKNVLRIPRKPNFCPEDRLQFKWLFLVPRKVSEGTKGPIEYEFSRMRVTLSKDGLPWKIVWLIIKKKRTIGKNPTYSFFHKQCSWKYSVGLFCLAMRDTLGNRAMFLKRERQSWEWIITRWENTLGGIIICWRLC